MRFTGEMSRRSVCNIGQASTSQDITRCVSQISACTACRTLVYRIAPTLCLSLTGRGTKTTIGLLPARYGIYDRNGEMEVERAREREREKPKKTRLSETQENASHSQVSTPLSTSLCLWISIHKALLALSAVASPAVSISKGQHAGNSSAQRQSWDLNAAAPSTAVT